MRFGIFYFALLTCLFLGEKQNRIGRRAKKEGGLKGLRRPLAEYSTNE